MCLLDDRFISVKFHLDRRVLKLIFIPRKTHQDGNDIMRKLFCRQVWSGQVEK